MVGDYRHAVHQVAQAMDNIDLLDSYVTTTYDDVLQLYNQSVMPSMIIYEFYRLELAWLPTYVIKNTFEQATWFCRMPIETYQ